MPAARNYGLIPPAFPPSRTVTRELAHSAGIADGFVNWLVARFL